MGDERHYFEFSNDDIQELQNLLTETSHLFDFEQSLSTTQSIPTHERVYHSRSKKRKNSADSISSNISTSTNCSSKSNCTKTSIQNTIYNKNDPINMFLNNTPPTLDNFDYTTIKYVISYYLLEENTYGIEKIIIFAKHDPNSYNPQQICSEKQQHYHYIIKFQRNYYDAKVKENKPLFPVLSEIKVIPIKDVTQYNNCISFISNLKQISNLNNLSLNQIKCDANTNQNIIDKGNNNCFKSQISQNCVKRKHSVDENEQNNCNEKKIIENNNEDSQDEGNNDEQKSHKKVLSNGNKKKYISGDKKVDICTNGGNQDNGNGNGSDDDGDDDHDDHDDDDGDKEITLDELNNIKEKAKRSNSIRLMGKYLNCLEKYKKQEETKKTFNEIIEKEKPLSDYEFEVLRYDYDMRMSVFRACHLLDLIDARNKIQSKSDICPIYILIGGKSCGKSKIAYHVANTIGKCAFPLVAYTHNDNAALGEWYETGSDVLVFEDFDFIQATDLKEPHKILANLKKWASGQEIYFVDASKLSKHSSHVLRTRKLKAIFLCVNKVDDQMRKYFQCIPEKAIEFEFLLFGPEYSYNPDINQRFLNMYPDSCNVCDKSMYKFLKHYQKCKIDGSLNNSPKGFRNVRRNLFPARYPFSIEMYTTDYKYALGV